MVFDSLGDVPSQPLGLDNFSATSLIPVLLLLAASHKLLEKIGKHIK